MAAQVAAAFGKQPGLVADRVAASTPEDVVTLYYDVGGAPAPTPAPAEPTPTSSYAAYATPPPLFDLSAVLGGVAIGRDLSGNFAVTLRGVAVVRPNGTWVTLAR